MPRRPANVPVIKETAVFSSRRIAPALVITAALLAFGPAGAQDRIKLKAIGQPLATGLIQKNKEQPFFENFAARTGLPIDVDYKPIDTLGIKDTEQLRVMKAGLFDIVSLRVSQNSRDEPTLLGLDLVGASPDYATGRKVAKAYFDSVDARLQQQFNVKLLGVWPFITLMYAVLVACMLFPPLVTALPRALGY